MNLKILILLTVTLIANTANAKNLVTCELRSKNNNSVHATIDLTKSLDNGVDSGGDGLNVGIDNYSFGMAIQKNDGYFDLDVIFYENNNVQDEVGGFSCKFIPNVNPYIICQESITDEGKTIAHFSCTNH